MSTRRKAAPLSGTLLARRSGEQSPGLVVSEDGLGSPEAPTVTLNSIATGQRPEFIRRPPDNRFDELTRHLNDPAPRSSWLGPVRIVSLFAVPLAAFLAVFWYAYDRSSGGDADLAQVGAQRPAVEEEHGPAALVRVAPASGPVDETPQVPAALSPLTESRSSEPTPIPAIAETRPAASVSTPTATVPSAPAATSRQPASVPVGDKPPPTNIAKARIDLGLGRHYTIQFVSVRDAKAARREWTRLQRTFPDLLRGLESDIEAVALRKRGTFHRVRAGAFENRKSAEALCAKFTARKQGCLVVRR